MGLLIVTPYSFSYYAFMRLFLYTTMAIICSSATPLVAAAQIAPSLSSFCHAEAGGVRSIRLSQTVYLEGDAIWFCAHPGDNPLSMPPRWRIVDASGALVQDGVSALLDGMALGMWNGRDRNDAQAPNGFYRVLFPGTAPGSEYFTVIPAAPQAKPPVFSITPSAETRAPFILLSSYTSHPHSTISVYGYAFDKNAPVQIQLGSSSAGASTDDAGSFTGSIRVPDEPKRSNSVRASSGARSAETPLYIGGYYPTVEPSSYYLLPNQTLTWSGKGFAPHAAVLVQGPEGYQRTIYADQHGAFSRAAAHTIPFSQQNNTIPFRVESADGTLPVSIVIGTFYPNLEPSTYYAARGARMSAAVSGFAPGEAVSLYVNGMFVGSMDTGENGSGTGLFWAPQSGSVFELRASGNASKTTASRTVALQ